MFIAFLAALGFINALFLYWQHVLWKQRGRKMFCLIGQGCAGVVDSEYGSAFGIQNEITGMVYYVCVILLALSGDMLYGIRLLPVISGAATAFSFYLLFIQTAILRKFCFWCMIAIIINFLLFSFIMYG